MNQHRLQAQNISAGYQHHLVISEMNIQIPNHQISIIIGANGCGKSTLLKTFCKLMKPHQGSLLLDGQDIYKYSSQKLAQKIGLMPQSPITPANITVAELVSHGRFPYRQAFQNMSQKDYDIVAESLELMGMTKYANTPVDELSGGQRQRAWIALALAQDTDILFLDEPTTFLDIAYQIEILDLLTELNQRKKTTIVMVLHDINLSARYAHHLFALSNGKLIADGTPQEILTESLIQNLYHLNCQIIEDPIAKSPLIIPIGQYHK